MSSEDTDSGAATEPGRTFSGPIAWMAQNSVASNLLMFVILIAGFIALSRVKQEVFPEFTLDVVNVSVPYPGASPEDVEQGITLAVEEKVRGVDGVKRVSSAASEGVGTVSIELLLGANPDKVLADVKNEVDRITSFPEEAEEPQVQLAARRTKVVDIILHGDADLGTLHGYAEDLRRNLMSSDGVTQVDVSGVPPLEVSIEVPRERLEAYGITLEQVSQQVTAASLELPGGGVDTSSGEILVRVSDRRVTGSDFANIIVRSSRTGANVRLGDIASITDGFQDTDQALYFNERRAVQLTAYRVGAETPTGVSNAVRDVVDAFPRPNNVDVAIWDDDSEMLRERIDLLVRNARTGLILVVLVLALFLDLRLAFWVSLGIPISFMGAFMLMPTLGQSINMVSLFALIVTLGMVVDDAIIVGENVFDRVARGEGDPMTAAIEGAQEMAAPVSFAILTTIAAFAPLFIIPGTIGKIFSILPAIVVAVLVFSLIESFFILPAHLAHSGDGARSQWFWAFDTLNDLAKKYVQGPVAQGLQFFSNRMYKPLLELALAQRYISVAIALAMFVVSVGVVASGFVPFSFFPKLEGNVVTVSARLPYGVPIAKTEEIQRSLEVSARKAVSSYGEENLVGMLSRVGSLPPAGGPGGGGQSLGSHLVAVQVELVPTEIRDFSSLDFSGVWEDLTPPLVGLESLTFSSSVGPGAGSAVAVRLQHPDTAVLSAASEDVAERLRSYPELTSIQNGYSSGKVQLDYSLTEEARSLAFTGSDVARQLRSAFYGSEALREQRGRNEVKVMVRLPQAQRDSEYDLEQLRVRSTSGGFVPLGRLADYERGRSPTTINREDGARLVDVSADLKPGVKSSSEVLKALETDDFVALKKAYPGLKLSFVGMQREQGEAFSSLLPNYAMALFVIYALLAIPSRSYLTPIAILAAVPMGFVGAVAGHLIMDFGLSMISMMGIIALSGVVVNDSLVLVDAVERFREEGLGVHDAIITGAQRRLRPILLTSLTTFFGLAPMIFETSIQARFLIPMALSLGFGVLFATFIILLLVPAIYLILEDGKYVVIKVAGAGRSVPVEQHAK